ncbi:hypothetical protein [Alicycliphilus denitrificans]|uniref:hypothetical protein n=1 Tax=Alicycliphilus denitrificans TaxID=179636 RepID=UPI0001D9FE78|nr:hypothetical protein [Alicycliphilus denitrificans]ADU99466.1 hypothetical protein Alide_1711 [Alicycliphilus denitrificans BC]
MTGKHHNWHKAWRRDGPKLIHDSGLAVEYNNDMGWSSTDDTTEAWSAFELARGVPLHDLQARLGRLLREAAEWDQRNP